MPAGEDADAITYDGVSNRVFSFTGDAHNSTLVDPGPGRLVANIPLGGKPESGSGPRPDSSAANPRRRPPVIPGTFMMMVVERAVPSL
jgi:hypothetical protein